MRKITFIGIVLLMCLPVICKAQYLRNSYFVEGNSARLSMNPALQPVRGYYNLPVIGAFNLEVSSNSLSYRDIMDVVGEEDDFYKSNEFINKLDIDNKLDLNLNTDIISFGYHKGPKFYSFNIGARVNVDASIPRSMFEYLRDMDSDLITGSRRYNILNEEVNVNAYTEIGFGYSRVINDRLTIGTKIKGLLGCANMKLKVNELDIDAHLPDSDNLFLPYADIATSAELELSGKGVELQENAEGYIEDVEFDKFGIGGFGAAIDLGINYKLTDLIALSAAILDFGFISWNKGSSTVSKASGNIRVDGIDDLDVLDFDLFGLKKGEGKSRTTRLCPTLVLGGEYSILENKIGLGILSTTRFGEIENYSELTASATFRPGNFFNATVSYSLMQGSDTFGLALKLGGLFVGTDYMFLGDDTKHVNAYVGLSIPLAKKK